MAFVGARRRAFSLRTLVPDVYNVVDDEYTRLTTDDIRAFERLGGITSAERTAVKDRVVAAIRRVGACSAPYALSNSILESTFDRALELAAIAVVIFGLLRPSSPQFQLITIAAGFLGVFVFAEATLRIRLGWRFDVAWYLAWTVLLGIFLLRPSQQKLDFFTPQGLSAAEAIALGVALYSLLTLFSIFLAGIVYVRATNHKKCYPEEEIIETLLTLMDAIEQNEPAWVTQNFRAWVATLLDWIADRFEFDFFRHYVSRDSLTITWSSTTATEMAGSVRTLKQNALLPNAASMPTLLATLKPMFLNVARGQWGAVPRLQDATPASNRKELITKGIQTGLSIAIPLAAAALVLWAFPQWHDDAVKTSVSVALISFAVANVLAAINPSGFDKQVSAAKTISEVLRPPGK